VNTALLAAYRGIKRAGPGHQVGRFADDCLQLARAEIVARAAGMHFAWKYDEEVDGPADWGWSDSAIERWTRTDHTIEWCAAVANGDDLASLGGIWDADGPYRRIVEAELALESLPFNQLGLRIAARACQ